jgi:response regulator RpfG family c-di-GMP phosphodiesterase
MTEKVLFVDDNENILSAIRRQLRHKYEIHTALSAKEGVQIIQRDGPFAVVVSDMKMPEMDGIEFLKAVSQNDPNCMRIMLTGYADQSSAMEAINEGKVFRFLNKPSSVNELSTAIDDAIARYQVLQNERQLLSQTLNGSVKTLTDILSLIAPKVMSTTSEMVNIAVEVSRVMQGENLWEMEMAIRLSRIAYTTLPEETLHKIENGEPLHQSEQLILDRLPEAGYRLLSNIPRLESVANIILFQNKNFDGSGVPDIAVSGLQIPLESRIIRVLRDVQDLKNRDKISPTAAIEKMKENSQHYDPNVMKTVAWYFNAGENLTALSNTHDATIQDLQPGMKLESGISTPEGRPLFSAGHVLTEACIEKLIAYHAIHTLKEPVVVTEIVRTPDAEGDQSIMDYEWLFI